MENFQAENQQKQNIDNFNQPQPKQKKQIPSWLGFVIIIAFAVFAFGGVFGLQYYLIQNANIKIENDSVKLQNLEQIDETSDWKTYRNEEYGFEIKYPKGWHYKEFLPEPVTTSYKVFNYDTKKYDNKFVKENTDFVAAFGPTVNLMPTVFRGGDGYITITVFNGNMEDLFNRDYERSGWMKHYIETKQKNMTFDKYRNDFYGEKISIDNREAFKVTTKGQIPDALDNFKVIISRVENKNIATSIIMENINNLNNTEEIYEQMLSTFRFVEVDETSDWKTYRNEKYGFEIKLKQDWTVKYYINSANLENPGWSGTKDPGNNGQANDIFIRAVTIPNAKYKATAGIRVVERSEKLSLDKISSGISTPTDGNSTITEKSKAIIDRQNAYDETISFMEICRRTVYFVKDNEIGGSYVFSIDITRNDLEDLDGFRQCKKDAFGNNSDFDQMLSTFKFTK